MFASKVEKESERWTWLRNGTRESGGNASKCAMKVYMGGTSLDGGGYAAQRGSVDCETGTPGQCATRGLRVYSATRGGLRKGVSVLCGDAAESYNHTAAATAAAPTATAGVTLELTLQDGRRRRATRVAGASLEFTVFLGECLSRGLCSPRLA